MAKLADTFEWAVSTDVSELRRAIRTASFSPLRAIGSGGSLTVAHALVAFHQQATGRLAAVATPLDAVIDRVDAGTSSWLLSASGGNVDITAAAKVLIAREPRHLAVLSGRQESPLADLCRAHPFVDLLLYPPPAGRDGFLATNSLLGFTTLIARAYATEFGAQKEWDTATDILRSLLCDEASIERDWQDKTRTLWSRTTTLVLHGPSTRIGAIDLESKFTEAALGNLQVADYRNFAHGRHHWLAKRADASAVLAFVTKEDCTLAERTLALIPPNIPQARLVLPGTSYAAGLASLFAALRITGWAGAARAIDPGRPGVPEFGRKLYNMPLPRFANETHVELSPREASAIERKSGRPLARLATEEMTTWRQALERFRSRLRVARFAGLVLDYDGTVIATRDRFRPPTPEIAAELARLAGASATLAIATGRGASVRRDLQACLPRNFWPSILIGYYNGAEIAPLDDDGAPDGRDKTCESLAPLAAMLRAQPELAYSAHQTDRPYQITLEAQRFMPEGRLWDIAHQVILFSGTVDVCVTRSSHSIDIVAAGVSKLNVVARLRDKIGRAPVLAIGDRGLWPGNDFDLLREPFALAVDEISVDPETCWNLASPGQRGPAATLEYLSALQAEVDGLHFAPGAFS
jgi:fructoselysine-6-P-deglycase FrlB-like protein/trehalose-6-phosphatase